MLNFIQVSFCFLLFLGLRLGLGLCLGTDNLQNIKKYLIGGAAHVRHSLSTDACHTRKMQKTTICSAGSTSSNQLKIPGNELSYRK